MKKLILPLLFLVSCTPVIPLETPTLKPTQTPEIIYVEVTVTPELDLTNPDYYFNSWEVTKQNQGAKGMFFILPDGDCLIFAVGETAALHEVGHCADSERGNPSQDEAFQLTVYEYVYSPPTDVQDELHHYLFVAIENGMYDEAFAQLYMWNILYSIPQEFEEFYAR